MVLQELKDRIERKRTEDNKLWKPIIILKDFSRFFLTKIKAKKCRVIFWENKSIFFSVPKVACTSLTISMGRDPKKTDEITVENLDRYTNYFKFAFVRNPYDRILSCYTHLLQNKGGHKHLFLNGMYKELWRFNGKFWPGMTFKEFVKSIHSIPDKKSNTHFQSQSFLLTDKKNNLIPNRIGKFENLKNDFYEICKDIGLASIPILPKSNVSKRKKDFISYYDEETKKLIQERYSKDFKLFSYSY